MAKTINTTSAETPVTPLPSYLSLAEADDLASALPMFSPYKSKSAAERLQLLVMATLRVDASHRWQGRRFDPDQALEFPRVPYGDSRVWDWSPATNAAVVPLRIKFATIVEAGSIADGEHDRIARLIDAGLTGQSTGSVSEQYRQIVAGQAGSTTLCREAEQFVSGYVLRSGRIV